MQRCECVWRVKTLRERIKDDVSPGDNLFPVQGRRVSDIASDEKRPQSFSLSQSFGLVTFLPPLHNAFNHVRATLAESSHVDAAEMLIDS